MAAVRLGSKWVRTGGAQPAAKRVNSTLHVAVPAQIHDDYCGSYPLTYEFELPTDAAGCVAQWRSARSDGWSDLNEPSADREDGIAMARFDYPARRAYVSVPFAATTDDLWVRVVDAAGQVVGRPTGSICEFYDDRRSAVVVTYDDWFGDTHAAHMNAAVRHQANRLWMSPGVNGEYPSTPPTYPLGPLTTEQWQDMDATVAAGWVEPHNHGLTHKAATAYGTIEVAESEIVGGRQIILDNITMPPQSRRGSTQYAHGFVEPNGQSTGTARSVLGAAKYLSDRRVQAGGTTFTTWDETAGLYNRASYGVVTKISGDNDVQSRDAIIDYFDTHHAIGGEVILIYSYAYLWQDITFAHGTPGADWIEHVGSHDDIWSVGWGHIYQYRKLWETVTTTAVRQ